LDEQNQLNIAFPKSKNRHQLMAELGFQIGLEKSICHFCCKRQFNSPHPALKGFPAILKNNPQESMNHASQNIQK
jgi:hypothetical protein